MSQIDERLNRPLEDPIAVSKDRETARVFNCLTCLENVQRGFTAAGDRELRRLKSLTADCRALQLLKSAKPSRRTEIGETPLDPSLLPPTLGFFPGDEELRKARTAQRGGLSWTKFESGLKLERKSDEEATVESPGGVARLQLYARGDFNGDGLEDVLLRDDTYPQGGTYTNTRLFVLTRHSKSDILRVIQEYD